MISIKKYKMLTKYFANLKIKISSIIKGRREEVEIMEKYKCL